MTPVEIGLLILVVTLVILFSGLPIAWGLTIVSVGFLLVFEGAGTLANVPVLMMDELSSFALVYRNVELANWHSAIQPFLHEMARDQVHFGPIGAAIFANAVGDAVDRLAALPPLRDESADLSLPTPF